MVAQGQGRTVWTVSWGRQRKRTARTKSERKEQSASYWNISIRAYIPCMTQWYRLMISLQYLSNKSSIWCFFWKGIFNLMLGFRYIYIHTSCCYYYYAHLLALWTHGENQLTYGIYIYWWKLKHQTHSNNNHRCMQLTSFIFAGIDGLGLDRSCCLHGRSS